MLITNKDKEVSHLEIQKDIINQIIKEIQMKNIQLKIMKKLRNIYYKYMEKLKLF